MPKQIIKDLKIIGNLKLLFLSIFIFATATGINAVIFPALLTINNISPRAMGFATIIEIGSGIIISFALPKIIAKFKPIPSITVASIIYSIAIIVAYFFINFWYWLLLTFTMGMCWFTCVIIRQAWLNSLVDNKQRGTVIGIFSMLISAGLAIGPLIVNFSGAENYLSFIISGILSFLSLVAMLLFKTKSTFTINNQNIPIKTFFKNNPLLSFARFFLDFQTFCLISFTVVFGNKIGLSFEKSGILISSYMASGFSDVIIGIMLRKYNPYKIINVGFLICLSCFLITILSHNYQLLLILYFLFGVGIACIFVSVFKITNDSYKSEELISANTTFQRIGGLGSICGGLLGGVLIDIFGYNGFPIAIIIGCISYLTFLIFYKNYQ